MMLKRIQKGLILFFIGGSIYIIIEIIYRAVFNRPHTHWTMFLLGGIAFLVIGSLNEHIGWDMLFQKQVLIGTAVILLLEFSFGCVLNLWLGLGIWDYSHLPFNILGQVCLPFALLWALLAAVAIVLDDYLRYWMFGEDKPTYRWK